MTGKVFSINLSKRKGVKKIPVAKAVLLAGLGFEGDAHSGSGDRQVSLLPIESIRNQPGPAMAGVFAENITTEGIDLSRAGVGERWKIGREAVIEISKIGKECRRRCSVYRKTGSCIMPAEGVFAIVIKGGFIEPGDTIEECS